MKTRRVCIRFAYHPHLSSSLLVCKSPPPPPHPVPSPPSPQHTMHLHPFSPPTPPPPPRSSRTPLSGYPTGRASPGGKWVPDVCLCATIGSSGGMEPWTGGLWGVEEGGGGRSALCANINNSSQEGEETPGVKVRRNLMISSFCQASVDFHTHHL